MKKLSVENLCHLGAGSEVVLVKDDVTFHLTVFGLDTERMDKCEDNIWVITFKRKDTNDLYFLALDLNLSDEEQDLGGDWYMSDTKKI